VDYRLIDGDNHYYEATDAFTRHGDEQVKSFVRWVSEGKKKQIVFGAAQPTAIGNPTFDPITRPGIFHTRLKELAEGGVRNLPFNDKRIFGELVPLSAEYRDREARLLLMDEQGVEKAIFYPTLGVGIEGLNANRVELSYKLFHAFNLWLDEDWGFAYRDRIYAAPHIPVLDPSLAAAELDFVLERGAKIISLRPGPANGRSPADPVWDPFWARVNEAGIVVSYHGYPGMDEYAKAFRMLWQRHGISDEAYDRNLEGALTRSRCMEDTAIALVLGNLFGRFPKLRVFAVELGMAWVYPAMHALDHAGGIASRSINAYGVTVQDRPSDIFKEHFWISPFPEEDLRFLIEQVGIERVVFGSDWPHAEGTVQPADYVSYLDYLDDASIRRIMRDNAAEMLQV
jgi:predicted TIM-barrel fold metal-dependent hydrolase